MASDLKLTEISGNSSPQRGHVSVITNSLVVHKTKAIGVVGAIAVIDGAAVMFKMVQSSMRGLRFQFEICKAIVGLYLVLVVHFVTWWNRAIRLSPDIYMFFPPSTVTNNDPIANLVYRAGAFWSYFNCVRIAIPVHSLVMQTAETVRQYVFFTCFDGAHGANY